MPRDQKAERTRIRHQKSNNGLGYAAEVIFKMESNYSMKQKTSNMKIHKQIVLGLLVVDYTVFDMCFEHLYTSYTLRMDSYFVKYRKRKNT